MTSLSGLDYHRECDLQPRASYRSFQGDRDTGNILTSNDTINHLDKEEINECYEPWGDAMLAKQDHHFRIGYLNINTLPCSATAPKSQPFLQGFQDYEIDILGIQEVGLYWSNVNRENQWYQRTRGELERSQAIFGFNIHAKYSSVSQHGGTGLISTLQIASRSIAKGKDETSLGRWVWNKYNRQGDLTLQVATVYRLCDSKGAKLVNTQHTNYFNQHDRDCSPYQALLDDLRFAIDSWRNAGDQIIVMGDFNDEICLTTITNFFASCDMRDIILEQNHGLVLPGTWSRNENRKVVDGIWASLSFEARRGGYIGTEDWIQDHCLLWSDLAY